MREMMAALGGGGGLLSRVPGLGRLAGAGGADPALLAGLGAPAGRTMSASAIARKRQLAKKKRKQQRKDRKKSRRR
jgi:hypothetical protein